MVKLKSANVQSLVLGTAVGLVFRNLGIVFLFVQDLILSRWLGAEGYGMFSFTRSLFVTIGIAALLGFDTASMKFTAIYRHKEDHAHLRGLFFGSQALVLLLGLLVVAGFFIYCHFFPVAENPLGSTLFAGVWLVPIYSLARLRMGFLRGLERVAYGNLPEEIIIPTLTFTLVWFIHTRFELTSAAAMWAFIVANCGGLVAGLMLLRICLPKDLGVVKIYEWRTWLSVSMPMLLTSFTQQFLGQIEILLLGRLTTMAEVGLFSVANRISVLCRIPNNVVGMVISPLIAKVFASGERDDLESIVHIGALGGFLGGVLLSLPLVIWPDMVLQVFGREYVATRYVLLLLIAGNLVHSFFGPNGQLLMMTGNELFVFKVMVISIATDVALNLSLIPVLGAMGAAIAATLTLTLRNIIFNLACKRRIGIAPYAKLSRRSIHIVRSMISR